jgi:ATP/ADP translocase
VLTVCLCVLVPAWIKAAQSLAGQFKEKMAQNPEAED